MRKSFLVLLVALLFATVADSQTTIQNLPAANSAHATDEIPANQSGTTRTVTPVQIIAVTAGQANGICTLDSNGHVTDSQLPFQGVTYVWPSSQGGASTVLTNDGSGNLSWASGGGGGANTALSNLTTTALNVDLNLNGHNIVNHAAGPPGNDVTLAPSRDVNLQIGRFLNLNSHRIINVTDPASAQDAATKNYVDTHGGGANTSLSNLTSVAINSDLLPANPDAYNLGDSGHEWNQTFTTQVISQSGLQLNANNDVLAQSFNGNATIEADNGAINLITNSGVYIQNSDLIPTTPLKLGESFSPWANVWTNTVSSPGTLAFSATSMDFQNISVVNAIDIESNGNDLAITANGPTNINLTSGFKIKLAAGDHIEGNNTPFTSVADPTNPQDVATKNYVDNHVYWTSSTVTLAPADILALDVTPIELVPAPAAGQAIIVDNVEAYLNFNSVAYDQFPNISIGYDGGDVVVDYQYFFATSATSRREYALGFVLSATGISPATHIVAAMSGTPPTVGDSPITFKTSYHVITVLP